MILRITRILTSLLQDLHTERQGISIAEMVVTLAILTIISMMVLVNFSGIGSAAALERSAREMAAAIRAAQISAISVRYIPKFDEVPPAIGVYFNPSAFPNLYGTFADRATSYNFRFDTTELIETFSIDQKARINRLLIDNVPVPADGRRNIIFVSPEATMYIVDDATIPSGMSVGDVLEIELIGVSGRTKSVIVRTTGQISVR